jgi:hypothetical protein
MKRAYLILTVFVLFITFSCGNQDNEKSNSEKSGTQVENSKYSDIIGKKFNSLVEFDAFKDYTEDGGAMVDNLDNTDFSLGYYSEGHNFVVSFEKIEQNGNDFNRILLDICEITDVKQNQYLSYGCRINGQSDSEILALYESNGEDVEYFTKIIKAWRANRKTGKFDEIDINGIDCINPGFGV